MTIIYVLIPIAIILTIIGIYLFFWAVKSDQFTDLEKQGLSILFDEEQALDKDNVKDSSVVSATTNKANKANKANKNTETKRNS